MRGVVEFSRRKEEGGWVDGNLTHLNLPSRHREVPSEKKAWGQG